MTRAPDPRRRRSARLQRCRLLAPLLLALLVVVGLASAALAPTALADGSMSTDSAADGFTDVEAGYTHTLALDSYGSVWAWGADARGQLGIGSTIVTETADPTKVLTNVRSIHAAGWYSVAQRSDGSVWTWGDDQWGQLANGGTPVNDDVPKAVTALAGARSIELSESFGMAIMANGTVKGWGLNNSGQLGTGIGGPASELAPVSVPALTGARALFLGETHSFALMSDGTVKGWGSGANGEFGPGAPTSLPSPTLLSNVVFSNVRTMAVGTNHTVLVNLDGSVVTFGRNDVGQLGVTPSPGGSTPVTLNSIKYARAVTTYDETTAVISADGKTYVWGGSNANGELGTGDTTPRTAPYAPAALTNTRAVAIGGLHGAAMRTDGTVWTWGANGSGQLGDGTITGRPTPIKSGFVVGTGFIAIYAGQDFAMGIQGDGSVFAWGNNYHSSLGDNSGLQQNAPVLIPQLQGARSLDLGSYFGFAVMPNGTVMSWGDNSQGELASGDTVEAPIPATRAALNSLGVRDVVAGGYTAMAITNSGTVVSWGYDSDGELANAGTSASQSSPGAVAAALNDVRAITMGEYHGLAIRKDGSVWSWGKADDGQLCDGTITSKQSPVATDPMTQGSWQISAGRYSSAGILADGTVWTCGLRDKGLTAEGIDFTPGTTHSTPAVVAGLSGVRTIDVGWQHAGVITSAGTVYAWGDDLQGQLGDGGTTYSNVPVAIPSAAGAFSIALGVANTYLLKPGGAFVAWGTSSTGALGGGGAAPPPNSAPDAPSTLKVFRSDGTTLVSPNGWTSQNTVELSFDVSDPDTGQQLTPWIELKQGATPFAVACATGNASNGMHKGTVVTAPATGVVRATVSINGLTNLATYQWRACVEDAAGAVSPYSTASGSFGMDNTMPGSTSVSVVVASTSKPALSWGAAADTGSGVVKYRIMRGAAGCASLTNVGIVTAAVTSFVDNSATPGTYCYQVYAEDGAGNVQVAGNGSATTTMASCAGATLTGSAGLVVDESTTGSTVTYDVTLTAKPANTVNVTLTTDSDVSLVSAPVMSFTPTDWNVAHTVTVRATADQIAEGPHTGSVSYALNSPSSSDPVCTPPAPTTIGVTDDDTAGIDVVVGASGSLVVGEGGATSTYSATLRSQPVAPVRLRLGTGTQLSPVPDMVFDSTNWSTPQTVIISAAQDPLVETSPHNGTLTPSLITSDPMYGAPGMAPSSQSASITDDDVPGVSVSSLGGVSVAEAGGSDTYSVVLSRQPQSDVAVIVGVDAQVSVLQSVLTFTNANWNVPQLVTVVAVDDDEDEPNTHTGTILHSVTTLDPLWSSVTSAASVTANVTDDDTAEVIAPTFGYNVSEAGTTDGYDIVLRSQPTSSVTVNLNTDGQVTASPSTVVITRATWNVPRHITLTAVDDDVAEGPHSSVVSHVASSADPLYSGRRVDLTVGVTDDDNAGFLMTPPAGSGLVAHEGGAPAAYTVRLTSQPLNNVRISLSSNPQLDPVSDLVFTPSTWNVPKSVALTPVDDFVDENDFIPVHVSHSVTSADPMYSGRAMLGRDILVQDDDLAGYSLVGQGSVAVTESGATSDTFTVVLTSKPLFPVTLTPTADSQVLVTPSAVSFTGADWSTPRTVTVRAVDDPDDEAASHPGDVTWAAASADPLYNGLTPATVRAAVSDNDTAGVHIAGAPFTVSEAGPTSTSVAVSLDSRPANDVTIWFAADGQVTAAPTSVTLTRANWAAPHVVTVTAVDDPDVETALHTGHLVPTVSSIDPLYNAMVMPPVSVDVADDDVAGIEVDPPNADPVVAAEGGAAGQYKIRLTSRPRSTVGLTFATGTRLAPMVPLSFSPADWDVWKVVSVAVVDDVVDELTDSATVVVQHAATSSDPDYDGLHSTRPITVTDDDVAGVTVDERDGVSVGEAAVTTEDAVSVVLHTKPLAPVTVTVTTDGQVGADVGSGGSQAVFTATTWNAPQLVRVHALDDHDDEDNPHPGAVTWTVTSADARYSEVRVPTSNVQVADDDTAAMIVARPSDAGQLHEGAEGEAVTVRLASRPTAPVSVAVRGDDQVTVSTASLTFTPESWDRPQPLTVSARQDTAVEADQRAGVALTPSSPDARFAALTAETLKFTVTDDDAVERAPRNADPAPTTPAPTHPTTPPAGDNPPSSTGPAPQPTTPSPTPTPTSTPATTPAATTPQLPSPMQPTPADPTRARPVDEGTRSERSVAPKDEHVDAASNDDSDSDKGAVRRWAGKHKVAASVAASGASTIAVAVGAKALGMLGAHSLPGGAHAAFDWTDLFRKARQLRRLRQLKRDRPPSLQERALRRLGRRKRGDGDDGGEGDPFLDDEFDVLDVLDEAA